jgi:hypothetical protein
MKTAANAPVNTVTILIASDSGQDEARRARNLAADQRPAAIARPASAQDVVDAVGQAAMTPWAARQMYLNFADTSRDPASFQDPQAYSRLRQVKAAVDPQDRIRSNHPVRHHPLALTDTRKNDHAQPHHYYRRGHPAPAGVRGPQSLGLFVDRPRQRPCGAGAVADAGA